MIRNSRTLMLALVLVAGSEAQAQVTYNVAGNIFLSTDYDVAQTFAGVEYQTTSPASSSPNVTSYLACGIFPAPGCNSGPGPVSLIGANSDSNIPGVSVGGLIFAGPSDNPSGSNRGASATVTWIGTPSTTAGETFNTGSADLQQLTVSYNGTAPAPATVGIDVNYTVSSSIVDQSTGTNLPFSYAIGSVSIADPATFNYTSPNSLGFAAIQYPIQIVSQTVGPGSNYFSGAAEVSLTPGHEYWSYLDAITYVSVAAGAAPDLNLNLDSAAAARYVLDSSWLAANPQYTAGEFTITVATPLPAAAWLMLSGLGAMGAMARRRRKAL